MNTGFFVAGLITAAIGFSPVQSYLKKANAPEAVAYGDQKEVNKDLLGMQDLMKLSPMVAAD